MRFGRRSGRHRVAARTRRRPAVRKIRPCCRLKFTNRFVATTDLYELDVLRSAALDPDLRWGRRHALRVLGLRGDLAPFEWAKNTLATNTRGFDRAAALGYVESLPADVALRGARAWLRHTDGRGQAARKILATHAEPEDTVAIRHALDAIDDDYYAVAVSTFVAFTFITSSVCRPSLKRKMSSRFGAPSIPGKFRRS